MVTLYVYLYLFHNLEKILNIHVSGLDHLIKPSIIQGRVWGNQKQAKFEHLTTWWCSLWLLHMQASFLTSAWWRALYLAIIFLTKEIVDIQQVFTISRNFNALHIQQGCVPLELKNSLVGLQKCMITLHPTITLCYQPMIGAYNFHNQVSPMCNVMHRH
jgi:hypothetical protein